jgi:DNA-directed RNA polymerase I subunit RPA2
MAGEDAKKKWTRDLRREEVGSASLMELTRPHVDSFDYFVERGLEMATRGLQQVEVTHPVSGVTLRNILLNIIVVVVPLPHPLVVCLFVELLLEMAI